MMDGMEGMGAWMIFWGLLGLALFALIVLGIVWLVRSLSGSPPGPRHVTTDDPAEQELRHRYATGELTRDEYQQCLTDLRQR